MAEVIITLGKSRDNLVKKSLSQQPIGSRLFADNYEPFLPLPKLDNNF